MFEAEDAKLERIHQRNVVPILIEGLRKLEYRGYDSACSQCRVRITGVGIFYRQSIQLT